MTRLRLHRENHLVQRIGWLRAAVLGANDGIVSTASLIVGVAAAATTPGDVLIAGVAGLVAGAMSMAAGEYVSVSSQADTEHADLAREGAELAANPVFERDELAEIYVGRGVESVLARQVAEQLMAKGALAAHARDELGISAATAARPLQAALKATPRSDTSSAPPTCQSTTTNVPAISTEPSRPTRRSIGASVACRCARCRVAPGDVVARIEQPQLRLELAQAEAERDQLADSMEDINRLQVETAQASKNIRDQMRAQAETSSRFLEERLKALTALSKSVEDLRTRGIVNVERLLTLRSDLADAQERLSSKEAAPLSLLIEELNQKGLFRREQLQLQERLAAVQHRISRITNQLKRESAVVSRDYGVVSEVKVTRGDLVKFDTAVVSMLPNSDTLYRERPGPSRLIAAAFIPAQSGKKVRPGMSALVDPLSVRRDVYGGMIGTVIDVSDVPLTRERMLQLLRNEELVKRLTASGAPFLAHVALKADRSLPSGFAWTASSGPPTPVTSGTLAEVQITTERAALITLVIPALKELARGFGRNEERGEWR